MTPVQRRRAGGRDALAAALDVLRERVGDAKGSDSERALAIVSHALASLELPRAKQQPNPRLQSASFDLAALLQNALALAVDLTQATSGSIVPRGEGPLVRVAAPERISDGCSVACLPLRVRGETVAALYLEVSKERLERADRALLKHYATQAALAIDAARTFAAERERVDRTSTLQTFQIRILEAIASGVITLNADRTISSFNRSAETTFGVLGDHMLGEPASVLNPFVPDLPELLDIYFESGTLKLRAEVEARTNLAERTLEIALAPLEAIDGRGVAIVVTDVTRYRRLEIAHEAQMTKAGRIAGSFSRYLAPHVVEVLMNDPDSVKLGGERQLGTMMFADIRGFTSLAAQLPAERVVEMLNIYFDEAVRVIFEHDGLLDKFYGDGLMAVFGPPRARADDASRAVAAAIALHHAVQRVAPLLDYPLKISVGLASGEVVAGHVGSTKRMDYTVIGDAVNLASSLQSSAPPGTIYCDEATIERAGTIALPMERRTVSLKGRTGFLSVYAIEPPRLSRSRSDEDERAPRSLAGPV